MITRAVIATARCTANYDALVSALAHARARVIYKYRARSRAYDKWLDEKAEEADTVAKQIAAVSGTVSHVCYSQHACISANSLCWSHEHACAECKQ